MNLHWEFSLPIWSIQEFCVYVIVSSQYFKESKLLFYLVATTNHSQNFTYNKHRVNYGITTNVRLQKLCIKAWKYKQSVKKSCGEDEFTDESLFHHTIQLNG